MRKLISILVLSLLLLSSCGTYNTLLKSGTDDEKLKYGKIYFLEKKYSRSVTLLGDIVSKNAFSGKKMEQAIYLLAESFLNQEDYYSAEIFYAEYVKSYPKGDFAEDSKYKVAYCHYLQSPEPRLDQSDTRLAIRYFEEYIAIYPSGDRVEQAYKYIDELRNKLAYKSLLEAKMYYNLGLFMGNNYRSAIVVAENALKDFPENQYREEFAFLILKSKYTEAKNSVSERYNERFSEVIDEYYKYSSEFHSSKNAKEAQKIFDEAKRITDKIK